MLSKRGILALHDILPNRFDPEIDVHRFWLQIAEMYACEEIVGDYQRGNLGLGIVTGLGNVTM